MHAPTRAAPPQHARMAPTVQPAAWRLELFYSSLQQLEAQIPFLKRHGIARVNIPNKKPEDDLQGAIRLLRTHMPELDICCHFSCKNQRQKQHEASMQRLHDLCAVLQAPPTPATVSDQHHTATHTQLAGNSPTDTHTAEHKPTSSRSKRPRRTAEPTNNAPQAHNDHTAGVTQHSLLQPAAPSTQPAADSTHTGQAASSVLVVSGGGKKTKTFDTLIVLSALATQQTRQRSHGAHTGTTDTERVVPEAGSGHTPGVVRSDASDLAGPGHVAGLHTGLVQWTVAFNPYLPSPTEQHEERERLKTKLALGLVSGVYLQMGSDLTRLEEGLQFLSQVAQTAGDSNGDSKRFGRLTVWGSVAVPTKQFLARMKFRPWSGVFLSEEYLSGVEAAERITRQVLSVYGQYGVVPLMESPVKTDTELRHVLDLLSACTDVHETT